MTPPDAKRRPATEPDGAHTIGLAATGKSTSRVRDVQPDVYGPSTAKRARRSKAEMEVLDDTIVGAVALDAPVTLRGVYYRCVSAGAVTKTENAYRTVGRRLVELRRRGRVSYRDITDGTRWITKPRTFGSWEAAIENTARTYRRALWDDNEMLVQLFTEKDAISGVLLPITDKWDVPLGVLRGYSSESFAWSVAQSLDPDRHNVLAQLGDHDPSGVGAWKDFTAKVAAFVPGVSIEFHRLAVTEEQIKSYRLPTRPTKASDTRARGWVGGSVEVDAIPAGELRRLVDEFIGSFHSQRVLEQLAVVEEEERRWLYGLVGGAR